MPEAGGSGPADIVQFDIPQPKATLATGPGAGFGFVLFNFGDASVVAEGRDVELGVSAMLVRFARYQCRTRGNYRKLMCRFRKTSNRQGVYGWIALVSNVMVLVLFAA